MKDKMKNKRVNKLFKKPCKDCGDSFEPTGRFCRYCQSCIEKRFKERIKKIKENRKVLTKE